MKMMTEHGIKLSPAQIRKITTGGAITLKPDNFDMSSLHSMNLLPNTTRRVATALRKGKGLRVMLKPEEDVMMETEGGKISLKSIGRKVRGAAKDVGDALSSRKAINTYKTIGKYGTQAILNSLGELGGPAGEALAAYAGDRIGEEIDGSGLYKALSKVGISKKQVKSVGRQAVKIAASVAGQAITLSTGNPLAGAAFEKVASSAGREAVDKGFSKGAKKGSKMARAEGAAVIREYATANLDGAAQASVNKALKGKFSEAILDYGEAKLEEAGINQDDFTTGEFQDVSNAVFSGRGIVRISKSQGKMRIGGASPYLSTDYIQSMNSIRSGGMMQMKQMRQSGAQRIGMGLDTGFSSATVRVRPTFGEDYLQTGSPYASIFSPQMNPFIAASPQLTHINKIGSGFLPAGSY